MILDVSGTSGFVSKTIHLQKAVSSANVVKLKYLHLPDLPLLDLFEDGVTVGGVAHNILPCSSIQGLVNQLDSITHNGSRAMFCYYNQHEFEICTGGQAVTLSAALASVLKMSTALAANTCYSSALFESEISLYSHYAVRVAHAHGYWNGSNYNEIIARVRRDNDVSTAHSHYFSSSTTSLGVEVSVVSVITNLPVLEPIGA